jgi:peptidoglycan/xylan/chitin deacetylase (PgdA/CDA1 family)
MHRRLSRRQTAALALYYAALAPYRWGCRRRWQRDGGAPLMVLMYHRIADDRATPWTVGNAMFRRQIDWLAANFDVVSLVAGVARLRAGNRRPAVAITFDDGYADNCDRALPMLLERRIPCTYYVTSQNILHSRPFAHDVALGAAHCKPNTAQQIRELSDAGVEIGGHTRTHADLGAIQDVDELYDEIVGGAEAIGDITGRAIGSFAFPFGQRPNLSAAAFEVARSWGMSSVCSAYGGFNNAGDDLFHLQRFAVDDDMIRLMNWCGVDPRKKRKHPRFDFPRDGNGAYGAVGTVDACVR